MTDEKLAALEQRLPSLAGEPRRAALLEVAWHLRQRNTTRARALADEAETMPSGAASPAASARLHLLRAEVHLLFAAFDAAQPLAAVALAGFESAADWAGACDATWLDARLAIDRGDLARRDQSLARAAAFARRSGDALRTDLIDAVTAYHAVFTDAAAAEATWGQAMAGRAASAHPAVAAWAHEFHAMLAFDRSDYGRAIPHLREAVDAARRSGQIRRAIVAAANIGLSFSWLNDPGSGLEWSRQALEMARTAGWPSSIGVSLLQTADALRALDQPAAAHDMTVEALAVLAPLTGSINYLLALDRLGGLALERGDPQAALRAYDELEQRAGPTQAAHFRFSVLHGRARALADTGLSAEAEAAASAALACAEASQDGHRQITALQLLADLHSRFDQLKPPSGCTAEGAALYFLDRALAVAAGLPDLTVPDDLLATAAAECARAGDHARAYELALQASAARDATHGREARNRAVAMQVRHDTERARADSEHHRQLAAAETRRAKGLTDTLAQLERLNAERDETLAFLAHDLRAPLSAIVALLPTAPHGEATAATTDDAAARLHKTARFAARALSMTDRFLAMARLSRIAPDAFVQLDLASVVDEACETFLQRAFAEGKSLTTALEFGVAIEGCREPLTRALCNLIDNALRVTPPGGCVAVAMQRMEGGVAGQVAGQVEDRIELSITDAGPGMPPDAQAVLCGSRGGDASPGRLGLSIAAEVARLHGVRVAVSASPAGTRIGLGFVARHFAAR